MNLTKDEKAALQAAFKSAEGNGHDFGCVEDVTDDLRPMSPQAVGGVVSSLVKKGFFRVHAPVTTDSGTWTQFTWSKEVSEVKAMLKEAA